MKKINVRVYEDNGGRIHAVITEDGNPINIISGFEDGAISKAELIEAAQNGFSYEDYEPELYEGMDVEYVASEIEEMDVLIAEISVDSVEIYPEKMGYAGRNLFEIEIYDAE